MSSSRVYDRFVEHLSMTDIGGIEWQRGYEEWRKSMPKTTPAQHAEAQRQELEKQNDELVAVLEKIALLRHSNNSSAASLAQSALDTMRLLKS